VATRNRTESAMPFDEEYPDAVEAGAAAFHEATCGGCLPDGGCDGEPTDIDRETASTVLAAAVPYILSVEYRRRYP
jgi:hypothetical protein